MKVLDRTISSLDDESLRKLGMTFPEPADRGAWWRSLTALTQKWAEYSREAAFRESLADVRALLSPTFESVLQQIALLTVKPDGLAGRRVGAALKFLRENDFSPVHLAIVGYTPLQSRDLWRYQWNTATLDRLCLWDLACTRSPSLMLVVRDESARPEVPAAVRLRALKGSTVAEFRAANTLRTATAVPNRILSLVHAPDEPIDIVREIGIVVDRGARRDWLSAVAAGVAGPALPTEVIQRTAGQLYSGLPHCDFALEPALLRLRARLRTRGGADGAPVDELLTATDGVSFRSWADQWLPSHDQALLWDVITVASHVIQRDEPGEVCTIDDDGRPEWYAGLGNLHWKG